MKKKIVTITLLVALAAGVSACGGSSAESTAEDTAIQAEETDSEKIEDIQIEESEPVDDSSSTEIEEEKFKSMEELLSDPEAADALASTMSEISGDEMTMEVYGDGAKLVYSLTLLDMGGADSETMANALIEAFEPMSDYWVELATSLREAVDVPTPVIVIEILDPDGSLLMKEEYPAN